jgi:hypothetical protein
MTVHLGKNTVFRRYASDSVLFADAKPSSLSEVRAGDQLRARGNKSPDGQSLQAEEVVFGTFQIKAGSIIEVNAAGSQIKVKELGTNKPFVVKVTSDSWINECRFPAVWESSVRRGHGWPSPGPRPHARSSQMLERMPARRWRT